MENVKGVHRYCSLSKVDASIVFAYTLVTFVKTYHHEGAPEIPHMLGTYPLLII